MGLHGTQKTEASGGDSPVVHTLPVWGRLVSTSFMGQRRLWQQLHMRGLERTHPKGLPVWMRILKKEAGAVMPGK